MRPSALKTKIFLDGGNPEETKDVIARLGFLDGQTTNPTLIANHPAAKERQASGQGFAQEEIWQFYRSVVEEISALIPEGSVSIEVYADKTTPAEAMIAQGRELFGWISNAHIKYPITSAGLEAAEASVREGMRVNMTLCFTEEQAAAVYAATLGARRGSVFVSPFIGRLDDRGERGMDLIENILRLYRQGDGHTEVLAASVRSLEHLLETLRLGADIVTVPYKVLTAWHEAGMPVPEAGERQEFPGLTPVPYDEIDLNQPWASYNISHELTDAGIERFARDWNALIK